jgi:DNA gyrase/topoisomerase IV subunit A
MAYKHEGLAHSGGRSAHQRPCAGEYVAAEGQGETITSVMALPEDERDWDKLDMMFATKSGGVRRNLLSDFTQVNRNGKIAMKL